MGTYWHAVNPSKKEVFGLGKCKWVMSPGERLTLGSEDLREVPDPGDPGKWAWDELRKLLVGPWEGDGVYIFSDTSPSIEDGCTLEGVDLPPLWDWDLTETAWRDRRSP